MRQAQCWNDHTVSRTKDPNEGCQNWGQHLHSKHNTTFEHSVTSSGAQLGPGRRGSLTAQPFPQLSWPQHPQQSSLWSPMNTAAGMRTWVQSQQNTQLWFAADRAGKTRPSLCIHRWCLLAREQRAARTAYSVLFNTVGASPLVSVTSTPGEVYFYFCSVYTQHLSA